MDAKIDMLHQAGLIGSPQKRREIVEGEELGKIEDKVSSSRTKRPCWFEVDTDLERRNN
jgi:hypothetical protein